MNSFSEKTASSKGKAPNSKTEAAVQSVYLSMKRRVVSGHWNSSNKLPTAKALAKEFRCSLGVVSKAIALLVHEGLVDQKKKAGLSIVHNASLKSVEKTECDSLAFIFPSELHEGIARIVQGFQEAAFKQRRRVIMLATGSGDYRKEGEYIRRLSEFDVMGAVLYPIVQNARDQASFLQIVTSSQFPIVLVEANMPGFGCPSVVVDGFDAGYTATKRMINTGAKRIGYFSNYSWMPYMRERYLGYRWALTEAGLPEHDELVLLDESMNPDFKDPIGVSMQLAESYLKRLSHDDGVVCCCDFLAIALVKAAQNFGWKVPKDFKVIGIDDFAVSQKSDFGLTTYHVPYEEIGRKAYSVLSDISNVAHNKEFRIKGKLVERSSC